MTLAAFGIEAEWQIGALELASALHNHDGSYLSANNATGLHGYHCSCDDCGVHSHYLFHAQSDSSCSGEIISRKIDSFNKSVRTALQVIEELAVEVDAVPGWDAGFHVHVSRENSGSQHLSRAFFEFLRYEPVLVGIAAGRFNEQRDNNTSVRDLMHGHLINTGGTPWYDANYLGSSSEWSSPTTEKMLAWIRENDDGYITNQMLAEHHSNDRHSNLNVAGRWPTWEFRLWNSTRAAWRMELFIQLSRAFMVPAFIDTLAELDDPTDAAQAEAKIIEALESADMFDTCGLLARQQEYMVRVGTTISDEMTVL